MWKWDWSRFCAGVEIACGIVIGLLCVLASLAFVFSFSGCTNAVLEGPDGATEDVGVSTQELVVKTFINSDNGQALNDSGCKLRYVRGYTMGFAIQNSPPTDHNEYACTSDYCERTSSFPVYRKLRASGCVDILSGTERKCTLLLVEGGTTSTLGWFRYAASCNTGAQPKASLFCAAGHDTECNNGTYQRRVLDAPNNTLEIF